MSAVAAAQAQERITTGYIPRPLQAQLHRSLRRFNVIVCHRRFGKSVFSINEAIHSGLTCPHKNPRVAYLAPYYGQVKRIAWDYLKSYTQPLPGASFNEADLRVDIPRPHMKDSIRIQLLGAENPASLRGMYLDLAILDEYAEMNPQAWREVIRPTLSDRIGRAIFLGTPKGKNHFYEVYDRASTYLKDDPEWFSAIYRASESGIIPAAELQSARKEMTEEEYLQEYECSFNSGMVGAFYTREMDLAKSENRILTIPIERGVDVRTFWDLGINDSTAIWCAQRVGREWRLVDYIEDSGMDLAHYGNILKERKYLGEVTLPHDASVRELSTGKSRVEVLRNMGFRVRVLPKLKFEDGINAARMIFNKCWFEKDKCFRGIQCLENYRRKYDTKNEILSSAPVHDKWSHGADAFRYFALGADERRDQRTSDLPRQAVSDYDPYGV